MAIAKIALDRIADLELPADPTSFAVWYAYAAAQHPRITQKIDELLAGDSKLSTADIDRISDEYLSPWGSLPELASTGAALVTEVNQIVDLVATAAGAVADYRAGLGDADRALGGLFDRDAIREVVQTLVRSTHDAEHRNHQLETALRISKQVIENLQRDLDRILGESLKDNLTGLANRRRFEQALAQAIAQRISATDPGTFSLLLVDIDLFKQFNDTFGHQIGDSVLQLIAHALRESVRGADLPARYGGEEFSVLLPDTALDGARTVAENIRSAVARKVLRKRSTGETLGRITVSIGVAEHQPGESADHLFGRADQLLYAAKRDGRNTVR